MGSCIFIEFWLCWVFVALCGLSLVGAHRGCSSFWCEGFSLQWFLLLWSTGSRCAGFSSCDIQAQQVAARGPQNMQASVIAACRLQSLGSIVVHSLCGIWNLPNQESDSYPLHHCRQNLTHCAPRQVLSSFLGPHLITLVWALFSHIQWLLLYLRIYPPALSGIYPSRCILPAAAAAKSLQSCPTLCNPIDGSPPGSLVSGILQARTLEWGAIAFSGILPNNCLIFSKITVHSIFLLETLSFNGYEIKNLERLRNLHCSVLVSFFFLASC